MIFAEIFILIYAFVMIEIILYYSWVHHKMMKEIKKSRNQERTRS